MSTLDALRAQYVVTAHAGAGQYEIILADRKAAQKVAIFFGTDAERAYARAQQFLDGVPKPAPAPEPEVMPTPKKKAATGNAPA